MSLHPRQVLVTRVGQVQRQVNRAREEVMRMANHVHDDVPVRRWPKLQFMSRRGGSAQTPAT